MYTSNDLTPQENGSKKRSRRKAPADPKPSEVFGEIIGRTAIDKAEEARMDRAVLLRGARLIFGQLVSNGIVSPPKLNQHDHRQLLDSLDDLHATINVLADALGQILDA